MERRVVVTGIGMTTPLGETTASSWEGLTAGRSGIRSVPEWGTRFPGIPCTIAGLVPSFDHSRWLPSTKDVRRGDRFVHFAYAAAHQAWCDAGLPAKLDEADALGAGTIIGVGFGGLGRLLEEHQVLVERGASRVSAYGVPAVVANMAAGNIAVRYNLRGPNFAPASACASGAHGIGEGFMLVRSGRCDLVLAGGAEAPAVPLAVSAFASAGALCLTHNADPVHASRPFDKTRNGFVLAEGAGVMVLEELGHAKARGAQIHGELVGYGATCDAWHPTLPAPDGGGAAKAMLDAMKMAQLPASAIGYVNAHGTSTLPNDATETKAIKAAFGAYATDGLMVSSTKSMTGHMLGAAGGVEAIVALLAVKTGTVPPTVNYEVPDPMCDLDFVPRTARQATIDAAMSNCFGFGGTNAVLLFRRFDS